MIICCKCKQSRDPEKDFYPSKSGRAGYCKKCSVAVAIAYQKAHPDKKKRYDKTYHSRRRASGYYQTQAAKRLLKNNKLRYAHGITLAQYELMYAERSGLCDICKLKFDVLCVDHCHDTNENRGLLCHSCNLMIGNANDAPSRLKAGIDYLNTWSPVTPS